MKNSREYFDLYAGEYSEKKLKIAEELCIKIAPGHYSLLVSNRPKEIVGKRKKYLLIAIKPRDRREFMNLITLSQVDFIIATYKLGKAEVRFAKRMEKPIAIPIVGALKGDYKAMSVMEHNIRIVEENNGKAIIVSGAEDAKHIRSGRDLAAIAILFGMLPDKAHLAVTKWPKEVIKRAEKRAQMPAPGVEVIS